MAHAWAKLRRSFQCNQAAPAVANQGRLLQASGIHELGDGVCCGFHAVRGSAVAAAVAGQIYGQHIPAVVGQIAALQRPDAVVAEHAVNQDGGGLGGIKRPAAGVGVKL